MLTYSRMKQNIAIFFAYILGLVAIVISLWRCEPFEIDSVVALATILSFLVAVLLGIIACNYFIQKSEADKFKKEAKALIEKEREERNKHVVTLQEKVNSFPMEFVDSPEWIYAITDAKEHLLFGIKREDGSVEWSAGIPKPIKEKLDEIENDIRLLKTQNQQHSRPES